MRSIFKMECMKNAQDKGIYFWIFVLPILFTVLFITIFTTGMEGADKKIIITSVVPGYTVMFVFFIMISMGYSFLNDRDNGMVARLASTPLTPFNYLVGKWSAYLCIVYIQIIVLLLFGKIVYHIPIEQPAYLAILALLLSVTASGMGLALSMFIQTNNMGIAITQLIALGGAVLGGLWIPFDMMPGILQKIGIFMPQYWAHTSFQQAMNGTLDGGFFVKGAGILAGFSALSFMIAVFFYPKFLMRAKN